MMSKEQILNQFGISSTTITEPCCEYHAALAHAALIESMYDAFIIRQLNAHLNQNSDTIEELLNL